jgi:microcystin-dependent protein
MPYIGEIRMFGGNFPPAGWHFCDGRLRAISTDQALFGVIGTTYGGNGTSRFAMPDLRGRIPIHQGPGFVLGQRDGVESVTLTTQQIPVHTHALLGSLDTATSNTPQNNLPASLPAGGAASAYGAATSPVNLDPTSVAPRGGSQPHENMQPFLCVTFIISRFGQFPSPN